MDDTPAQQWPGSLVAYMAGRPAVELAFASQHSWPFHAVAEASWELLSWAPPAAASESESLSGE